MSRHKILWQHFPVHSPCQPTLELITKCFDSVAEDIASPKNKKDSNAVLEKVRSGLEQIGFTVETSKKRIGKINVPVLYGENGKVSKHFDADAYHPVEKIVLEVEAGRGVTNNQFLKDLFQACVMQDVDYAAIAVRQDYRGNRDYEKVIEFFKTIYASNRLVLPLKGVLIIGY